MHSISKRRRRCVQENKYDYTSEADQMQLRLRLKTLMDKKKLMQSHAHTSSKLSASFMALEEGFQQFGNDLNKLQVPSSNPMVTVLSLTQTSNLSRLMPLPSPRYSRKWVTSSDRSLLVR